MPGEFRYALCNEVFQKTPFPEACRTLRKLGYDGIEIAPFTVGDNPVNLTSGARAELRHTIREEGLEFVGLHWILAGPPGLHATTPDLDVRRRTWNYIHALIDLCADLADAPDGNNGVLVFGSPKQRSATGGMSPKEALEVFTQEVADAAPHAERRGVKILVEALPLDQSDVLNSLADAVRIVRQIGSPGVQTMFDVHNAVDEKENHSDLIRRYLPYIRHVHVNEMDGREPGMGDYDFAPLLKTLAEVNYAGWISVEAFDFTRDPEEIAKRAIEHLKAAADRAETYQVL
jgi:D-psicose/D-tagatose/L-ribulose 3-epimerase